MGMIGFALRGGILLLILPVLILPTAIEVRFLIGGNLNSTGLTGEFYLIIALAGAVTLGLALLILYTLARCELATFTRFVNSAQPSVAHAWLAPGRMSEAEQGRVTSRLFIVETMTLVAILVALLPVAAVLSQSIVAEIVLPSSAESIYVRIFNDAAPMVALFVVLLIVIEAVSAVVVRRVLAGAYGLRAHNRLQRHPLRVIGVCLFGWSLFIGAIAISDVVLSVTWQAVESAFLSTGLSGGLLEIVSALLVALLFGGIFAACLFLCGLVSTVRSGLWTFASLR